MAEEIGVLFIGDIVGKPGRRVLREILPRIKEEYDPGITIANGENAAGGFGITPDVAEELLRLGVDIITSGNHVWDKKEVVDFIKDRRWLLRPENFPPGVPGFGSGVFKAKDGTRIGILNLQGRVFMEDLDCPFRVGMEAVKRLREETPLIIVDFHGEATSEKKAIGWFLDGHVSGIIGTHTHVQTADERVLPKGTAYITDVGMTGAMDSVIGIKMEQALTRFLTQMPQRFDVASKNLELNGVFLRIHRETGKATHIERIRRGL